MRLAAVMMPQASGNRTSADRRSAGMSRGKQGIEFCVNFWLRVFAEGLPMVSTRTERRLAAILAADVVGYSRLVEQDEEGTLAALRDIRHSVIDPLLAEHRGRIIKLMGDGPLAEFGSVVDAVSCALAVQAGTAARQAQVAPERRIVFRIGINLGDVVVEGDDLLGDGVNIAARLEQLCEPGGVMISGTAYDHLKGKLNVPLDYAGDQRVKNISQPVRTYAVRTAGGQRGRLWRTRLFRRWRPLATALAVMLLVTGFGIWWFRPAETATGRPSVAVLPFDNLGGDDATGRLAAGVTEDIITDLSRYRDLDVMARNATAAYAGKAVDIRAVGKELKVRYVLEGSIQRRGEQVRVTAQLIEADRGTHVWSERWDRPATDVFAVQTEVAEQVATRLAASSGAIPEAERAASQRARPEDLKAYDLYRLGQEAMMRFTKQSTEEALHWFKQAVDQDPKLARAWIALAAAYDATIAHGADVNTARAAAMPAIRRSLELDPLDAAAHATFGHILGMAGDLPRAEAEFETALRLNPKRCRHPGEIRRVVKHLRATRARRTGGGPGHSPQPELLDLGCGLLQAGLPHGRPIRGCPAPRGTRGSADPHARRLGAGGRDLCRARPTGRSASGGSRCAQAPPQPHDRGVCPE